MRSPRLWMEAGGEEMPSILLENVGPVVSGEPLVLMNIMISDLMIKPTKIKVGRKKKTSSIMSDTKKFNNTRKQQIRNLLHRKTSHGEIHPYIITSSTRRNKVKDNTRTIIGEK